MIHTPDFCKGKWPINHHNQLCISPLSLFRSPHLTSLRLSFQKKVYPKVRHLSNSFCLYVECISRELFIQVSYRWRTLMFSLCHDQGPSDLTCNGPKFISRYHPVYKIFNLKCYPIVSVCVGCVYFQLSVCSTSSHTTSVWLFHAMSSQIRTWPFLSHSSSTVI